MLIYVIAEVFSSLIPIDFATHLRSGQIKKRLIKLNHHKQSVAQGAPQAQPRLKIIGTGRHQRSTVSFETVVK